MGGEERLGEDVVEREDAQEGDHHALVHGAAYPLRASGRSHPLVTGHHGDDGAEQRRLDAADELVAVIDRRIEGDRAAGIDAQPPARLEVYSDNGCRRCG